MIFDFISVSIGRPARDHRLQKKMYLRLGDKTKYGRDGPGQDTRLSPGSLPTTSHHCANLVSMSDVP